MHSRRFMLKSWLSSSFIFAAALVATVWTRQHCLAGDGLGDIIDVKQIGNLPDLEKLDMELKKLDRSIARLNAELLLALKQIGSADFKILVDADLNALQAIRRTSEASLETIDLTKKKLPPELLSVQLSPELQNLLARQPLIVKRLADNLSPEDLKSWAVMTVEQLGKLDLNEFDLEERRQTLARAIEAESGRVKQFMGDRLNTASTSIRDEFGNITAENVGKWLSNPDVTVAQAFARGENSVRAEIGNGVDYLKSQWWYNQLQQGGLSLLMEKPTYIVLHPEFPGEPIWYVNGIATTQKEACLAARLLSESLGRPVRLIHNATCLEPPAFHTGLKADGFGTDDLSECVYDRAWPAYVVGKLKKLSTVELAKAVSGQAKLQENPTTRQLAWVIYHAEHKTSIVTHSQGCMIARNAYFTAALLGKELNVRNDVSWAAAGSPLNGNETWPLPDRFQNLVNKDDPCPKLIGLNGGGRIEVLDGGDHNFIKHYINMVDKGNLLFK